MRSRYSGQLKSLVIFCGMAIMLSACSQSHASVVITPVAKAAVPSREDIQQSREDYQAIALSKLRNTGSLTGSDPEAIARQVFRNTEPMRGKPEIIIKTDYPRAVAIVTHIGIGDDSVRSIRYRAEFMATSATVPSDQIWSLVWAGSQFKCQPGRGHQEWSSKLCN